MTPAELRWHAAVLRGGASRLLDSAALAAAAAVGPRGPVVGGPFGDGLDEASAQLVRRGVAVRRLLLDAADGLDARADREDERARRRLERRSTDVAVHPARRASRNPR